MLSSSTSTTAARTLGGFGDGGIITTHDADLAERLRILRVHGARPKYFHEMIGLNSRLDALQAAVLRVKLRYLERWHEGRRKNAAYYDRVFSEAGAVCSGEAVEEASLALQIPRSVPKPGTHIYNQYVIRVSSELRDSLREYLGTRKISTEIYYPLGLHMQECFSYLSPSAGALPQTESLARESLAIPVYPELTQEQLDHVLRSVLSFLRKDN